MNTSALNRPFDDLSSPRVRIEAEAMANLVALIESQRVELVVSEYLVFEVSQGPEPERIMKILDLLSLAGGSVGVSPAVARRARDLERYGLRGLDALHVASAETAQVDLLVTTDDRMIRSVSRNAERIRVRAVLPVEALACVGTEGHS